MQSNEFQIAQLLYCYNCRTIQFPRGEPLPVDDTRTNQLSGRTEATLLQQPPKRTANPITYHRDSAALDKDQSQTKTVTNRRLCCHNHRPASLSYRDRPVSRQQPNQQNPKIMSIKPLTKTGTTQLENISKVGKGVPERFSPKQRQATVSEKSTPRHQTTTGHIPEGTELEAIQSR
jgi:hypothetical protein